jgi:chemosensory pili system protein ChpC
MLPCLMLPLREKNLLLPSSAIAEIISFEKPKEVPDAPEWLVGILSWRGINIPLTYLEKIESHLAWNFPNHQGDEIVKPKLYIAVLNRAQKVSNDDQSQKLNRYPFFAIVLQNVPKLHHIVEDGVKTVTQFPESNTRFLIEVKVQSDYAFVPNLDGLWKMIDALPPRLQWFRQIII